MPNIHQFQVQTARRNPPWAGLAPILESFFPVRFHFVPDQQGNETADCFREAPDDRGENPSSPTASTLRVCRSESPVSGNQMCDIAIRFADRLEVPFPFRGRYLTTKVQRGWGCLSLTGNEEPLALSDCGPVWAVSKVGCAKHFRSGFPLPDIGPQESLADVLNGERFLEMLPLLHWIREVCNDARFEGPPLRACFILDDPNLHWPRYGYVHFREIAARAAKENYHVAFATIPLDGWFTHRATAELFKTNKRNLSLAVHGNDHSYCELARNYRPSERSRLLAQAIERTERLERRTGLHICRVMVPPHGACSEEMLAALPGFGFAAACISHGSLRAYNENKPWTRYLGYLPSERIQGCPVMPRWSLSTNTTNTILVAAYLKQPILLRGHHRDLKDGVELFDEHARFINSLGSVSWAKLSALCRINAIPTEDTGSKAAAFKRVSTRPTVAAMARRFLTEGRDRFLRR